MSGWKARAAVSMILYWTSVILMSATLTQAARCRNQLDIAIAVDTTSSQDSSSFENVKAEVKGIVTGFTVGGLYTRLALICMSNHAQVVANFEGVKSLSDFNAAVDRLLFTNETVDLSEGVKVATDYMQRNARTRVQKILILVKDRRSIGAVASSGACALKPQVAALRKVGVTILAVGVGGLWNRVELEVIYGTEYLMIKGTVKALESAKSLNCEAECPRKATTNRKPGLCYHQFMHVINSRVNLTTNSLGFSVCTTEIERTFEPCRAVESCRKRDVHVGTCDSGGKVEITNSWDIFDYKLQSCVTSNKTHKVDCVDADNCPDQVAEVIFILDRSGSIRQSNVPILINVTRELVNALNVGQYNVRVGLLTFSDKAELRIEFGKFSKKAELLRGITSLQFSANYTTRTELAFRMAREIFAANARTNVGKYVFLLTDGKSTMPNNTFLETRLLKNDAITLYAIGIGKNVNISELTEMTAPETSTNLFILKSFDALSIWAKNFTKRLCIELAPPNPKLCDNNIFIQAVSECVSGKQQITKTEYKYDSKRRCIKTINVTEYESCRAKCVDPIDGNEYFEGENWTNLCHEFLCPTNETQPSFQMLKSKCLGSDSTCKNVGSHSFKCLNDLGALTDNCQCVDRGGTAVTVIEKQ